MIRPVSAAAILAIVLAGCVAPGSAPSASPAPRPSATQRTAAPTASTAPTPGLSPASAQPGERFRDPEGFYEMTVGEDWLASQGGFVEGAEHWFVGPQVDDFRPNVTAITQITGTMTFEQYTSMSVKSAPAVMRDFDLIATAEVLSSDGSRLGVMEFTGAAPNGAPLHFLTVWTLRDGRAIVVALTAPPGVFTSLRSEVEPYLLTLTAT